MGDNGVSCSDEGENCSVMNKNGNYLLPKVKLSLILKLVLIYYFFLDELSNCSLWEGS